MPGMTSTKSKAWKKFTTDHQDWMSAPFRESYGEDTHNPAEADASKYHGQFIYHKKTLYLEDKSSSFVAVAGAGAGAGAGKSSDSSASSGLDFINIFTLEGVPDFYEIVWNTSAFRATQAIDSGLSPDLQTLSRVGLVRAHLGAWRIRQLERAAEHGVVDHHHEEKERLLKIILQAVNDLKPLELLINSYHQRFSQSKNLEELREVVQAVFKQLEARFLEIQNLKIATRHHPETANFLGEFEQDFAHLQRGLSDYLASVSCLLKECSTANSVVDQSRVDAVFSSVNLKKPSLSQPESMGHLVGNTLHGLLSLLDHANRNLTTLQGDLHSCVQEAHGALAHYQPDLHNMILPLHQGDLGLEESGKSKERVSLFLSRSSRSLKESLLVIASLSGAFSPFDPVAGIKLVSASTTKAYPKDGEGLLSVPGRGVLKSLIMGVRNILFAFPDFGKSLITGSHEPVFFGPLCASLNKPLAITDESGRSGLRALLADLNTAAIPFGVGIGLMAHDAFVNFIKSLGAGVKEGLGELLGQMVVGSLSDFSYGRWFKLRHQQWLNEHGNYARYFDHAFRLRTTRAETSLPAQRRKNIEAGRSGSQGLEPDDFLSYQAADDKTGRFPVIPSVGHSRIRVVSVGQEKGETFASAKERKGVPSSVRAASPALSPGLSPGLSPSASSAYFLRPYYPKGLLLAVTHGLESFYNLFNQNIFAKHSAISFVFMGVYLTVFAAVYSPSIITGLMGSGTLVTGFIDVAHATGTAFASGRVFSGIAAGFTYAKVAASGVEKILHGQSSWLNKAARNFVHDPGKYTALIALSTMVGYLVANSYIPIPFVSNHLKEDAGTVPLFAYFFGALKLLAFGFEAFIKPDVLIEQTVKLKSFTEVSLEVLEKSKDSELTQEEQEKATRIIQAHAPRRLGRAFQPHANRSRSSLAVVGQGAAEQAETMDRVRNASSLNPWIQRLELLEYLVVNQAELPHLPRHKRRDIAELIRERFEAKDARALLILVNPIKQRSLVGELVHSTLSYAGLSIRCLGSVFTWSSHPWRDLVEKLESDLLTATLITPAWDIVAFILAMFDRTACVLSDLFMNQFIGRLEALVTCGWSHKTTAAAFYLSQRYNISKEGFKAFFYLPVHKLQARQTLPDLQCLVSQLYEKNTSELLCRYEQLRLGPETRSGSKDGSGAESGARVSRFSSRYHQGSVQEGLYLDQKLTPWSSSALNHSAGPVDDVSIQVLNPAVGPAVAAPMPFAYSLMERIAACVDSVGATCSHAGTRLSGAIFSPCD